MVYTASFVGGDFFHFGAKVLEICVKVYESIHEKIWHHYNVEFLSRILKEIDDFFDVSTQA
jgi:hypothetical protein